MVQLFLQSLSLDGKSKSWVVFGPQSSVSPVVFSICWKPEEVDCDTNEGMDVVAKQGQPSNEQNLSSLSLHRLPGEGVTQIKGGVFWPQVTWM